MQPPSAEHSLVVKGDGCCVLCASKENTLVQSGVRYDPVREVRQCRRCRLFFLWPVQAAMELNTYYTDGYRREYESPPRREQYRQDLDEARIRVRRILHLVNSGTRLLEIGSGSGAFLDSIRPYVSQVVGIEPDVNYRQSICSELQIDVRSSLDQCDGQPFDVVTVFHVLEHITEPVVFLRSIHRVMADEGVLLLEVPNVDDALVSVYRIPAYMGFYFQKAHLYYFSSATLLEALKQAGFSASVQGVQRYDISNHIQWMLTGQPGGQGCYDHVFLPSAQAAYADSLIRAGCCDTLWAIARGE